VISLPGCRSQKARSNFIDEKSIEARPKVKTLALNSDGRRRTSHAEKPGAIHLGNGLYVMMTMQNTIAESKDMVHWMDPDVDNWPSFAGGNGMGQCQARDRSRTGGKSSIMNLHAQRALRYGTRRRDGLRNDHMSQRMLAAPRAGGQTGLAGRTFRPTGQGQFKSLDAVEVDSSDESLSIDK
jgi:hypothetical protein